MNIKVSIIVPVYNSRKYLRRCLDSIVSQSLEEIEIILINDFSTDESIGILKEYKQKYRSKIIIIDLKENKKPGGARNEGMKIAKGEYIGFVDSDDYVEKEMYEELYKLAKQGNYDMVDCGFDNKSAGKMALSTVKEVWGELNTEKRRHLIAYPGFVWSKIFKRSILIDNNIRFREKITFEDVDFLPIVMLYLKNVYASDLVLYYYTNNSKSITSDSHVKIQINDKMEALRCLVKKFKELNVYGDYKDEITFTIYNMYIYMVKFYALGGSEENVNYEMFRELQEFFFELVDYDYHTNKYILDLDKKKRMYAELNNADYRLILDTCLNK
ncbi:glycosyltransferase [Clostridium sp. BL-8]|uniref:glycosyltransferase family 2 protein n=1 Tax=Clostridium sp. BL-8 TaxID=349938 RepID=UPI00098CA1BB|nr:glycosyltransferase [Clostridium sp. BL-8]OOM79948.1 putative glycosyltransferase EpsJ [Clostridium sp. BL-8]